MDNDLRASFRGDLEDVRSLKISCSRARSDNADLAVEYVGGQITMFEIDRYLIERFLEQPQDRKA